MDIKEMLNQRVMALPLRTRIVLWEFYERYDKHLTMQTMETARALSVDAWTYVKDPEILIENENLTWKLDLHSFQTVFVDLDQHGRININVFGGVSGQRKNYPETTYQQFLEIIEAEIKENEINPFESASAIKKEYWPSE